MVVVVVVVVITVCVLVGAKVNCAIEGRECCEMGFVDRVEEAVLGGETVAATAAGLEASLVDGRRLPLFSFEGWREAC